MLCTITGTLVHIDGEGLIRQPYTKTQKGSRSVWLPSWAQATVLRTAGEARAGVRET